MKRILLSLGAIIFVGAVVVGATGAFFSDVETSTGNTFTAGAIDLKVDAQAHYAGLICSNLGNAQEPNYAWVLENPQVATTRPDLVGKPCDGTWTLTDLGPTNKFFNIGDVKPGDQGENTISLHVDNNDAYACADLTLTSNAENLALAPEVAAGDSAVLNGNFNGELAQNINFFAWADNGVGNVGVGDNIWQAGEPQLFSGSGVGPASDVLGGKTYTLADSNTGPLPGGSTRYVGLQWCAGALTVVSPGVLSCNGATMGNQSQTDSMAANITFRVEQARNNARFTCNVPKVVRANDLDTVLADAAFSGKWFFYNDTNDTVMTLDQFSGTGGVNNIVVGPSAEGAAQMTLDTGVDPRYNIATYRYKDVKLADIGSLNYRIYDANPANGTPFLHFNVDFNNSDTWQKRLVQVPTGLVANTWTTVDALAGSWVYSGAFWPAGGSELGTTPGTTAKTWASILADYPNAETRSTDSFLGVRVGQPGPAGDTGYVSLIEFDGETTDFGN